MQWGYIKWLAGGLEDTTQVWGKEQGDFMDFSYLVPHFSYLHECNVCLQKAS